LILEIGGVEIIGISGRVKVLGLGKVTWRTWVCNFMINIGLEREEGSIVRKSMGRLGRGFWKGGVLPLRGGVR